MVAQRTLHQGPLPSPQQLEEYDRVMPGLKNTIVQLVTGEAEHQRALAQQALRAGIEDQKAARTEARIGQWLGFVLSVFVVLAGMYTVSQGHPWPGVGLSASAVLGLLVAFFKGRSTPPSEPHE